MKKRTQLAFTSFAAMMALITPYGLLVVIIETLCVSSLVWLFIRTIDESFSIIEENDKDDIISLILMYTIAALLVILFLSIEFDAFQPR